MKDEKAIRIYIYIYIYSKLTEIQTIEFQDSSLVLDIQFTIADGNILIACRSSVGSRPGCHEWLSTAVGRS